MELSGPYKGCKSFVVTKETDYELKTDNTELINKINEEIISRLKEERQKNIWIIGGGNTISHFINYNAIDEMIINVIPIILGNGIRLFQNHQKI